MNLEYQYLEDGTKKLYSVYHEPENPTGNIGVVLCNPIGQEYIRCHKLYVNLANKLSQNGFHALRFDYSGTGDSSGEFNSFTIESGIQEIRLAVHELKESCGLHKVILFGVRLGATLSLFCSQRIKFDGLALWNPILNGNRYLHEITSNYNEWLAGSFTKEKVHENEGLSNYGF